MSSRRPSPRFNPHPYPYHHELTVRIDALTSLGSGVGRDGEWVVFVPFTLPGERVRARIYRNHDRYSEADLVEVLAPAPERVEPSCPLFMTCGGCQYQHFHYEGQLAWKTRQVKELLERACEQSFDVRPAIGSPRLYGYRSKLTPHFQKPREGVAQAIGFLAHGSARKIIDVPQCPLATDAINAELPTARESVKRRDRRYRKGGTLLLRDTADGVITDPQKTVTERVGDLVFQFPAGEFFQNNPFILPRLTGHVVAEATADPNVRHAVDAYCGSGLFALHLAKALTSVVGVEISAPAVQNARANALINSLDNVRFQAAKAEEIFADIPFPADESVVIIDPPRKGCDAAFREQLFAFGPRRVVYVSCNPATQARDLADFLTHGYRLDTIQPFDLFPHTRHIENVATLTRGEPGEP